MRRTVELELPFVAVDFGGTMMLSGRDTLVGWPFGARMIPASEVVAEKVGVLAETEDAEAGAEFVCDSVADVLEPTE